MSKELAHDYLGTKQQQLSGPQIVMLRTQWRNVYSTKGPTVIGMELMNKLFFKLPHIRKLFMQVILFLI
jgi:hypothetical protein